MGYRETMKTHFTVDELIRALQKFDGSLPVMIAYDSGIRMDVELVRAGYAEVGERLKVSEVVVITDLGEEGSIDWRDPRPPRKRKPLDPNDPIVVGLRKKQ